jgi:hypothetical protein
MGLSIGWLHKKSESFGLRPLLLDAGGRGLIFSPGRSIAQESEEKLKSLLEGSLLKVLTPLPAGRSALNHIPV